MYAGTTIGRSSGRWLGAHQKIDRVARRALAQWYPDNLFPAIADILHFEGNNGPDALKRKSPAKDEPWHYYNPADSDDTILINEVSRHSSNLTTALSLHNAEKAAFEAAWLAHAIIDGLTPAHHYPLKEELEKMRGASIQTRTSIKDKLIIKKRGDTGRQLLAKNWRFWGAKGIMTTHGLFEWGVATTIAPLTLKQGYPTENDCAQVIQDGIVALFKQAASDIYRLHMYERFYRRGWTASLARETRKELAPLLVKTTVLAWYEAAHNAYKEAT